jgi:galactokinase
VEDNCDFMQVQNSDPSKMKLDEANHWALKAFLKLYHKQSGSVDFEGWRIVIEGNMPASAQIQKHALRK